MKEFSKMDITIKTYDDFEIDPYFIMEFSKQVKILMDFNFELLTYGVDFEITISFDGDVHFQNSFTDGKL